MIARPAAAELVERREVLPGHHILAFHAPALAVGSRAGQFVQVRGDDPAGLVMRRAYPLSTADASTGIVTIQVRAATASWAAFVRTGDAVEVLGPFGRPFEVDPRSRHLLLMGGGPGGIAAIRMLADEAVRDGRQVTLLYGAASARDVYPSTLLPDEVEYVVATEDGSLGVRGTVTDLVPAYEAWADQAFAAGPRSLLGSLARLAAGRRARLGVATLGRKRGGGRPDPVGSPAARRRAFLQVALEGSLACAAATCLGCVVPGSGGMPQRVCREGPVFAAEEIDWEAGW